MRFTAKAKQNITDVISVSLSELFPGKKISGVLEFPSCSEDIKSGYGKDENVAPDVWIDFFFTHEEIERACGLFVKIKEVGTVPVYRITVSTYYDDSSEDFFDTIFHEIRHAWQKFYGYTMSEADAEGYAKVLTSELMCSR